MVGRDIATADFVAAHPCDILISIANERILKPDVIAMPRLGAINYHNAPLPRYAGMWATAWAILNGESEHGITWHRIDAGLDTGGILIQRCFGLDECETTATLNSRCSVTAINTLEELFQLIDQRSLSGVEQRQTGRSLYRRRDLPVGHGLIDWRGSADSIVRLVRACDWGPVRPAFGQPRLTVPAGLVNVLSADIASPGAERRAGTIINVTGCRLVIACITGSVVLELAGFPGLTEGQQLPEPQLEPYLAGTVNRGNESFINGPSLVCARLLALSSDNPTAPAIEDANGVMTRGGLISQASAFAALLQRQGVTRGDGIGIHLFAGRDFVVAALGAMMAGGAYVPLRADSLQSGSYPHELK